MEVSHSPGMGWKMQAGPALNSTQLYVDRRRRGMKEKMSSVDLSRIFFSPESLKWGGPSSDRIFCSGEHRFFKTRNWESLKKLRLICHSYIHPFSTSKKESESWFSTNLNRPALALKLVCYRCWIYCRIPVNGREGGRGLAERIRTDNRHLHFKGREGGESEEFTAPTVNRWTVKQFHRFSTSFFHQFYY